MFSYHRVMYILTENTDFNNLIAMIPWKYLMTNLCLYCTKIVMKMLFGWAVSRVRTSAQAKPFYLRH